MAQNEKPVVDVEEVLSKTEIYIEENKQNLIIIASIIIALVGGYFAYKYIYVADEEKTASAEMYKAEAYFAMDSLEKAINGDGIALGFAQIAEDYSITPSGNLAEYYLGISYLRQGKFEDAIEHLEAFEGKDVIVSCEAIGAIGDAKMELGNTDEAISYYIKAAEKNVNNFTSPLFLKKAAMANETKGEYEMAVKLYERIKNEFSESTEANQMDKYIGRAKALGNL